jgi:hypothetical protein
MWNRREISASSNYDRSHIISSSPAPVCSGGAGARPEWALLDSQNKVSSTTEGRAVSLLVRCMRGEESLLQSVLRQRLAPLVVS